MCFAATLLNTQKDPKPLFIFYCFLQEMEKLKEELENMNDLMEQKDTLTQKLEVGQQSH